MPHSPTARAVPAVVPALGTALDGVVVPVAGFEAFDCPQCGDVRELLAPDGDPSGPDRACVECGLALVVPVWFGASTAPRNRSTG